MKELNHEQFKVTDDEKGNVNISGILRLNGLSEYKEINEILDNCINFDGPSTVNLKKLEFLNSSGITMLSKMILTARKKGDKKLILLGSTKVLWQVKSLKNLKRLMPNLELIYE